MDLLAAAGATGSVELRTSTAATGQGLFAVAPARAGDVLLRVPREVCLMVDFSSEQGLTLPDAAWPRLRKGISFPEPLTWDLLLALAMMDATAGDGGGFWEAYVDQLLPQPKDLTLPLCWDSTQLAQLQHAAITEAAAAQQERLLSMFPGLCRPAGPGLPSWLQWGFACVRSRAVQVAADGFGVVPFLDMANHADQPNANFRVAPDGAAFELVALSDVRGTDEVSISYSGPRGFTNQRWMAQYGFVPEGGNSADRLPLEVPDGLPVTTLRLEYLQSVVGDVLFADALRGRNKYLYAALKSLPLADEEQPGGGGPGGDEEGMGTQAAVVASSGEAQLAAVLLEQVAAAVAEGSDTALEEDVQLLQRLRGSGDVLPVGGADHGVDGAAGDGALQGGQLVAAVQYRVERKRLLAAVQLLLKLYLRK